jgi:hypothetical protein
MRRARRHAQRLDRLLGDGAHEGSRAGHAEAIELVDKLALAQQEAARRRHLLVWVHQYARGEKLPNLANVPQTPSSIVRNVQASPYDCYPV